MYFTQAERIADEAAQRASNTTQRNIQFKLHKDLQVIRFYPMSGIGGAAFPVELVERFTPEELAEGIAAALQHKEGQSA